MRYRVVMSLAVFACLACGDSTPSGKHPSQPADAITGDDDTQSTDGDMSSVAGRQGRDENAQTAAGSGSGGHGDPSPKAGSAASAGAAAPAMGGAGGHEGNAGSTAGTAASGGAGGHEAAGSGGNAQVGSGGNGGSQSSAGSAGTAGNSGAAGAAGTTSDAGASGEAGSAAGSGAAGSGGNGAEAGSSGTASQQPAAGSGGDASGAGGTSSSAGAGGAGGSTAGAGGDAGSAAGAAGSSQPPVTCSGPPGLYAGTTCTDLAPGVEAFAPQFPLVTDDGQGNNAVKARWIYLPAGSVIDTSNPDRWAYPVGTIMFKEFADPKSGKRIETRRLEKVSATTAYASWTVQSYAWSSDQLSVTAAPAAGVPNALGSGFDIPSNAQCKQCHQLVGTTNVDAVIGFNAIQLNHDLGGVDLATLLMRGQLQNVKDPTHPNVTLDNAVVPGNDVQRAGIGYLHGHCSHCHGGPSPHGHQLLWTPVGMTKLTDLPMFGSGMTGVVCHCLDLWTGHSNGSTTYRLRINPSSGSTSGIIGRMSVNAVTSARDAMPPVGRKGADPAGIATVKAFIDSLDGTACAANPPSCAR